MNRAHWRCGAILAGLALAVGPLACSSSRLRAPTTELDEAEEPVVDDGKPVRVQRLACELDLLERHIECFGSIVPKRPDVWGQARLMMHRHEFEQIMADQRNKFDESLQGWISRRDQAYLANAFSLQAVLSGDPSKALGYNSSGDGKNNLNTAISLVTKEREGTSPPIKDLSPTATKAEFRDSKDNKLSISIEPTLRLNQQARYLNHLHQLRRINEGDDNADSPGYSLNLVRIPVSILAGSHTDRGFGAEMTATARLHLTPDLLPTTFRNLVIQDMVDLLTVPVAHAIGVFDAEMVDTPTGKEKKIWVMMDQLQKLDDLVLKMLADARKSDPSVTIGSLRNEVIRVTVELRGEFARGGGAYLDGSAAGAPRPAAVQQKMESNDRLRFNFSKGLKSCDTNLSTQLQASLVSQYMTIQESLQKDLGPGHTNIPGRNRVIELPMPPSQLSEVFGAVRSARVIAVVYRAIRDHLARGTPYHLDARGVIADELAGAYSFLSAESHRCLWDRFCTEELARAVRARDDAAIERIQSEFLEQVAKLYPKHDGDAVALKPVTVFAWALLVEAALLEERLHQDMKAVAGTKGCPTAPEGLHFHGPEPSPQARQAFNDYVQARWPVYVFALDPVTEDQNVAEDYSMRQEMQFALALAFATGQINASTMTKYVRRIEKDMATVSLNRTVVGYSHGDQTFGWRFYPRLQTPRTRGTLANVADLLNPPDDLRRDLRDRRIENGQRECLALMVMPSFVPRVDIDFSTHWFRLDNPKFRHGTVKDAMTLSKRVQCLRTQIPRCDDAAHYQGQDIALMLNKLDQLAARLPLQHHQVTVPFENTAGGFELFSNGITDLSPELHGWYGAPGVDTSGHTSIFLVGDNFSVHQTRVVVGGLAIGTTPTNKFDIEVKNENMTVKGIQVTQPTAELLSRQILRVTIPPGAKPHSGPSEAVDLHVATPYGVSRHLRIPVLPAAGNPPANRSDAGDKVPAKTADAGKSPELVSWEGVPHVDIERDTALFLVGKNFQTGMRVIAGGVELTEYKEPGAQTARPRVEFVGPGVLRVTLPPKVPATEGYVDVFVATIAGVSNRLRIPLPGSAKVAPKPMKEPDREQPLPLPNRLPPANSPDLLLPAPPATPQPPKLPDAWRSASPPR